MAQLNVDADRLADEYHNLHQPHTPVALLSPNSRAHLVFPHGTVTTKFEEELCFQASAPPLSKSSSSKLTWSELIVNKINWSKHGQAPERNKARRTHLVKFMHDILPTTSRQNKYDGGNQACPLCKDPLEDNDNILRCQHTTRETWRQNFLTSLSAYCRETQTCPQVSRLLNEFFRQ